MKKGRKYFSLLLIVIMVLALAPMTAVAGTSTVRGNTATSLSWGTARTINTADYELKGASLLARGDKEVKTHLGNAPAYSENPRTDHSDESAAFGLEFISERPILSATTSTSIRSANGAAPQVSSATTFYMKWNGTWPTHPVNETPDMDVFLVNADTLEVVYYYGSLTLPTQSNSGSTLYNLENLITYQAKKVTNGVNASSVSTVADGSYYIAVGAGGSIYYFDEVGIVYSSGSSSAAEGYKKPILTMPSSVFVDPNPEVLFAYIDGRIYSPCVNTAIEHGFYLTDVQDYFVNDFMYELDQSFNIISQTTTANSAYTYQTASNYTVYNIFVYNGSFYVCDKDGYFSLVLPVLQSQKHSSTYVFANGANSSVQGVECFYYNDACNGNLYQIGGNKSSSVSPVYNNAMTFTSLTATNGTATAAVNNIPYSRPVTNFAAQYSVNGGEFQPFALTSVSANVTGNGTMNFVFPPFAKATYPQSIAVNIRYTGVNFEYNNGSMTAAPFTVAPVGISSVVADNGTGRLTIQLDEIPVNVPAEEEFTITWDGGLNPKNTAQALTNYTYDPATGTVTFDFTPYGPYPAEDQIVVFHVEFNGITTDSNEIIGEKIPGAAEVEIVFYNAGTVSVQKSEKTTLEIQTNPVIDWNLYTVTWASADKTIASVNSAGVVTGKGLGLTIITATITDLAGNTTSLDFYVMVY